MLRPRKVFQKPHYPGEGFFFFKDFRQFRILNVHMSVSLRKSKVFWLPVLVVDFGAAWVHFGLVCAGSEEGVVDVDILLSSLFSSPLFFSSFTSLFFCLSSWPSSSLLPLLPRIFFVLPFSLPLSIAIASIGGAADAI